MSEEWKSVRGYKGLYEISNLGNLRSLDRVIKGRNKSTQVRRGRVFKLKPNKNTGYVQVNLYDKYSKVKTVLVHRLVATAFKRNRKNKPYVNHKNGIKADNRSINLEWCTSSENSIHAYQVGLSFKGSLHGRSKLNENQVLQICKLLDDGKEDRVTISNMFGTNPDVVSSINLGKSWNWLTGRKESRTVFDQKDKNHPMAKAIINCRGMIFDTLKEASIEYGVDISAICNALKGLTKHSGKYPDGTRIKWRIYEE